MIRLLYILPGPVSPSSDPARNKFSHISEIAEGEVLLPVWWDSPESVSPFLRETFPVYRVGKFNYHMHLMYRSPKPLRWLATFLFYLRRGLQLHRERKFDVIMTYGTNRTGLAGVILKWLTGAKLIVEVPGVPEDAYVYQAPHPSIGASVKRFLGDQLLILVGAVSDCLKLLYPSQLSNYSALQGKKAAVFHDFAPIQVIPPGRADERFILLAGFPWYTKGADILIRAFRSIAADFPDYKLKLMGYYPDRECLDKLAEGCPQIEILPPRANELALEVIGACTIYALASRSESMGRVLLEAMAARKPIVASAVGGVPHYITNGENGLLFEKENVEELAQKLRMLLSDAGLRAGLANKGYERVHSQYDERAYVRSFQKMLESMGVGAVSSRQGEERAAETMVAAKSAGA
jgi:glycosyltransferase involved in cell wall biosynthesis